MSRPRIWAKKPPFIRYPLRRTSSLRLVVYSPRKNQIEDRIVNPVSIFPPLASALSLQIQSPASPKSSKEQLEAQSRRAISYRPLQQSNWTASWTVLRALAWPTLGPSRARNSPTFTAPGYPRAIQPAWLREHGPAFGVNGNPGIATYVTVREVDSTKRTSSSTTEGRKAVKVKEVLESATRKSQNGEGLEAQFRTLRLQIKRIRKKSKESLKHWKTLEKDIFGILGLEKSTVEDSKLSPKAKDKVLSERGEASLSDGVLTVEKTGRIRKTSSMILDVKQPSQAPDPQEAPMSPSAFFGGPKSAPVRDFSYPPLQYHIDSKTLVERQALRDGSMHKSWSHQLYHNNGKSVKVHYCKTFEESEEIAKLFLRDSVVGFDMEWMSYKGAAESKSPRIHASLIQVANESDIALFHVSLFTRPDNRLIPPSLKKVIESKGILKVGVCITGDAKRIQQYHKTTPQGLFELSDLGNLLAREKVGGRTSRRNIALSKLVEQYLQLPLNKGSVRTSDWSQPLSGLQIRYAASDAYAGLRLFYTLEEKRRKLRPSPPRPACRMLGEDTVDTAETTKKSRRTVTSPWKTLSSSTETQPKRSEMPGGFW